MTNMPFNFPDPSVSTRIQNPTTLEWWEYIDGVWELDEDPEEFPTPTTTLTSSEQFGVDIGLLRQEIALLKATIISLEAEITAATVNNFLILE